MIDFRAGWTGERAGWLMLEHPEEAYRILRGYIALLGDDRVWWRATQYGTEATWPSAVRAAITDTAVASGVPIAWLSKVLDDDQTQFQETRARIMSRAVKYFTNGVR